jgi:predicted ester cyclase
MSTEEIKATARRFVLEHNQAAYLASFDELLDPKCVVHEYLPGLPPALDRAGYNQFIASFRAALPDIHNDVDQIITEGEYAVVRWTGYGTHTGEALMGIPAKGHPLVAHGIYILRIAGGRIQEIWDNWDNLNVLQQLGGMPGPG